MTEAITKLFDVEPDFMLVLMKSFFDKPLVEKIFRLRKRKLDKEDHFDSYETDRQEIIEEVDKWRDELFSLL